MHVQILSEWNAKLIKDSKSFMTYSNSTLAVYPHMCTAHFNWVWNQEILFFIFLKVKQFLNTQS
jgi:hypothetical protein